MPSIFFHHSEASVGDLVIDNGVDDIQWAYNLNTTTFPTYGGEVIQILSVYIDSLTMTGTISSYKQAEMIYGYFASYMQIASQGQGLHFQPGETAYNLKPMYFTYPERNWSFKIYPLTAAGFTYSQDVVAPTWQLQAHIIDDSPDLDLIKNGIKTLLTKKLVNGADDSSSGSLSFGISGQISPDQGNPDTDPFQTYDAKLGTAQNLIALMPDYYSSLLSSYLGSDFSALTGSVGSTPAFGQTSNTEAGQITIPKKPKT